MEGMRCNCLDAANSFRETKPIQYNYKDFVAQDSNSSMENINRILEKNNWDLTRSPGDEHCKFPMDFSPLFSCWTYNLFHLPYYNNNNIYLKSNIHSYIKIRVQWTYNDIHNNHNRYTL